MLVEQYNNTVHSTIKMTPVEVSSKKNENKVCKNLFPEYGSNTLTQKFSVGDNVRIRMKKIHSIKLTLQDGWKRSLSDLKLI